MEEEDLSVSDTFFPPLIERRLWEQSFSLPLQLLSN